MNIEIASNGANLKYKFKPNKYSCVKLGRGKNVDIHLNDSWFSRIHTTFYFDDKKKEWYLIDGEEGKKSTNGTW